ncbi:MAG: hypothetical protein Q8N42_01460 [bacterium]|nr:hypothetical protein [bacterium]
MDGQLASPVTSFIPKTRINAPSQKAKGIGLGVLVSGLILLISLGLFGGVYFYKQSLQNKVNDATANLARAKQAFEVSLFNELSGLTSSISAAKQILAQHSAPSKILKLIGDLTLKDATFSNFIYNLSNKNASIIMNGDAKSYTVVALQAKLFDDSDFIDDVTFSNLSLKEGGKINFTVNFNVSPDFLIYKP